jgi:predicted nucleic acid-binding protein
MIVVDASLVGALTLPDEADLPAAIHKRMIADQLIAPVHFRIEVGNVLQMAVRRKRIPPAARGLALAQIESLSILVDDLSERSVWSRIFHLADTHGLTIYDAAYLELAARRLAALATLDRELIAAARSEAVEVLTF